ncbi:condensation domain-containing protein [Streptomyces sp. MSC1_001]|uniref:condensation domain-containing protein n=1 Tax=Streptomyces sp. MSC1_001 TaxID=2909263 RepID=UPI002030130D|nr:condensation domain-containing protein [Streptomyces sp. MSC1_001]
MVRSGRLTRGQEEWWLRLYWREQGAYEHAWADLWDLPPGISVDAAGSALSRLVERHEILRTAFVLGFDNLPAQVVFDPASFQLPVTQAHLGTLDEFRAAGVHPLVGGSLLMRPPWSVRLFVEEDEVRSLSFHFEHIITDGSGLRNLRKQFIALCHGHELELRITHPLDRRAKEERALHDSRRQGRPVDATSAAPQVLAPRAVSSPSGPRFLMSSTSYTGLLPLIDTICRKHSVSRSMVLMHAIGWLFAQRSDQPRILCSSAVGNRLPRDDSIDLVARHVETLHVFDEESTLRDSLASVAAATLRSYAEQVRSGPRSEAEARALRAEERGIGTPRPLYFNYQGPSQPSAEVPPDDPDEPVRMTRRDAWRLAGRRWDNAVRLNVAEKNVVVDFDVDAVMFPAHVVHRMSDILPKFVQLLADEPTAPLAAARSLVPAGFRSTSDTKLIGRSWVDTGVIHEVIARHPGVSGAHVAVDSEEVVARVSLDASTTLFDVHEYVLTHLHDTIELVLPRRYGILEGSAGRSAGPGLPDLGGKADWIPSQCLPKLKPSTERESELSMAIRETHGTESVNLALTYAASGGRAVLAPAVVETLRRRGFTGLKPHHFGTAYTLRAIARSLIHAEAGNPR